MQRFKGELDYGKYNSFNGTDSKIEFTIPTDFNPGNLPEFTFAALINVATIDSTARRVIDLHNNSSGKGFVMYVNQFGIAFQVMHSTTNASVQSGVSTAAIYSPKGCPKRRWLRAIGQWDDDWNYPKLFINSKLFLTETTNKSGSRANIATTTGCIGLRSSDSSRAFSGGIDEVGLWPFVWDMDEIENDFYGAETPDNPLMLLHMDEESGNLTNSGSANLGTITPTNVTQNNNYRYSPY